jgi:hypothetical protein
MRGYHRSLGILVVLLGIILLVGYFLFQPKVVRLLELTISTDGNITPQGQQQLDSIYYSFVFLLLVLGFVLLNAQNEVRRTRMKQVILSEPLILTPVKPSPRFVLWSSSLIGLFLIIHIHLYDRTSSVFEILYLEDGIFESLTPILAFIAALLLILPALRSWDESRKGNLPLYPSIIYLVLIIAFFLYAMEEISWGQRIIGWETPEAFAGNVQDETNIHNFFNIYFLSAYKFLILFPIPVIVSIWLEFKQYALCFNRLILPAPSLIGLSLLVAFVAFVWPREQELLEEMLSVFVLFYSLRLFSCFRARNLDLRPCQ